MRREATVTVKHNVEMAHRLIDTPGKCEAIHGHSWWVELHIRGVIEDNGQVLEFGYVKKKFREMLDERFDHHVLLNERDPFAGELFVGTRMKESQHLPGLARFSHDPTTENLAIAIYLWAQETFSEAFKYRIEVWETSVNCATVGDF